MDSIQIYLIEYMCLVRQHVHIENTRFSRSTHPAKKKQQLQHHALPEVKWKHFQWNFGVCACVRACVRLSTQSRKWENEICTEQETTERK